MLKYIFLNFITFEKQTSKTSGNDLNAILNKTYKDYRKEMEKFVNTVAIHRGDFDQIFYNTIQKVCIIIALMRITVLIINQ